MRRRDQTIAAYEQTIQVLRDEVRWLRAALRPESPVTYAPISAVNAQEAADNDTAWAQYYAEQAGPDLSPKKPASDDEDVIREMLENDEIDTTEAEALLEAVGAQNTEIEFAS